MEKQRKIEEHNKKMKRIIQNPLTFKKNQTFKRQNSYLPQLDDFLEEQDEEATKKGLDRNQRSAQKKRHRVNRIVKDVTQAHEEADEAFSYNSSESGS